MENMFCGLSDRILLQTRNLSGKSQTCCIFSSSEEKQKINTQFMILHWSRSVMVKQQIPKSCFSEANILTSSLTKVKKLLDPIDCSLIRTPYYTCQRLFVPKTAFYFDSQNKQIKLPGGCKCVCCFESSKSVALIHQNALLQSSTQLRLHTSWCSITLLMVYSEVFFYLQ